MELRRITYCFARPAAPSPTPAPRAAFRPVWDVELLWPVKPGLGANPVSLILVASADVIPISR